MDHTHVVAGGGKVSHNHDVAPDAKSHSHAPNTTNNATSKNLLPWLNKANMSEPKASDGALIAISSEMVALGEGRIPFMRTGGWQFNDYGELTASRDDLVAAKQVFDDRIRKQDWPAFFRGSIDEFGKANEDHDHHPSRAVGWMRGLEFRDDDHLDAIVDFNPVGDRLMANDQYRYSSAEMLRNWKDDTGKVWPLVPFGIALTNTPRIKGMGEILCSENGEAQLLAFSEGAITATSPRDAGRMLLAADDETDPDDASAIRVALADIQEELHHVYRAISATNSPLTHSTSMNSEQPQGGPMTDKAAGTAPETAATDAAPSAPAPSTEPVTQPSADKAEDKNILASERAAREAAQTELSEVKQRVKTLEATAKLATVSDRLEKAVREFRLTPAQRETYSEHMVELSEDSMSWFLAEIEAREPIAALAGELGVAGSDTLLDERGRLDAAAHAYMSEHKLPDKDYKKALLAVSSTGYGRRA